MTGVCVLGVVPYISLQIKGNSHVVCYSHWRRSRASSTTGPALAAAGVLAVFTILFGVRSVEATERHEGMVLAVALESLVQAAGIFAGGRLRHVRAVPRASATCSTRRRRCRRCGSCSRFKSVRHERGRVAHAAGAQHVGGAAAAASVSGGGGGERG
ncbi:MAG: hypothetical protein WKG07_16995 [Hymenobacter sp.]